LVGSLTSATDPRDASTPARGTLTPPGSKPRFVIHEPANAASIGDRSWVLVHASTGLWLHEAKTLARGARLVPAPIAAMAVADDGKAFAYVACKKHCDLSIVTFPRLERVHTARVDKPRRIRFSPDGSRVVVATDAKEEIQIVDVAKGKLVRIRHGEDINDAVAPGGHPDHVAIADDGDDAVVYDTRDKREMFNSAPLITAFITDGAREPELAKLVTPQRDQNAIAYDPKSDTLYTGGEDNKIWRFRPLFGGTPKLVGKPLKFGANVDEIVLDADGNALVGTDSLTVHRLDSSGKEEAKLGPLAPTNLFSRHIRVAHGPHGDALVVAGSLLARWDPTTQLSVVATDYRSAAAWSTSELQHDTALVNCRPGAGEWTCFVQRISHGTPGPDVATVLAGQADFANLAAWVELGEGRRLLAGPADDGRLRIAYLSSGGPLGPALDTAARAGGQFGLHPDGKTAGYVTPSGVVYELKIGAHELTEVARVRRPAATDRLSWDSSAKKWKLVSPFDR
jgi:dipeptidyl aminopeptidase/acylaminoacyl peptidase